MFAVRISALWLCFFFPLISNYMIPILHWTNIYNVTSKSSMLGALFSLLFLQLSLTYGWDEDRKAPGILQISVRIQFSNDSKIHKKHFWIQKYDYKYDFMSDICFCFRTNRLHWWSGPNILWNNVSLQVYLENAYFNGGKRRLRSYYW